MVVAEDLASLVIGLRADVAQLQVDLQKASALNRDYAVKAQGYWQDAAAAISQAFGGISAFTAGAAKSALTAFGVTGITDFAAKVVDTTAKLDELSQVTGISSTVLSSYSAVAAESGTTVDELAKTFGKFSIQMNDAAHNVNGPAANAFKSLGVSVTNADGSLRDSQAVLQDSIKKFTDLGAGAGRTAISMQLFGKGGQEMIPVLTAFGEGLEAAQKKASDLGLVVDTSTVKSFKVLQDSFTDLGLAIKGLFLTALREVAPEMANLSQNGIDILIEAIDHFKTAIIEIREIIDTNIDIFKKWSEQFDGLAENFNIDIKHDPLVVGLEGIPQICAEAIISFNNLIAAIYRFAAAAKLDLSKLFDNIKESPLNLLTAMTGSGAAGQLLRSSATTQELSDYDTALKKIKEEQDAANESAVAMYSGISTGAAGVRAIREETDKFILSLKGGKLSQEDEAKELAKLAQMGGVFIAAGGKQESIQRALIASNVDLGAAAEASAKKQSDGFGTIGDKLQKLQEKYNSIGLQAAAFLNGITAGITPADDAYEKYNNTIIAAQKFGDDLISTGIRLGQADKARAAALNIETEAQQRANTVLEDSLAKLARQGDLIANISKDYNDQASLIGLNARETAIQSAINKETDAWNKNSEAGIKNADTLEDVQKFAGETAAKIYDLTEAAKLNTAAATQFENIWSQAGDTLADNLGKAIVEGESLMKDLANLAKQVVEEIISYFAKLAFINPILNGIFGGSQGFQLLPELGNLFGGGTGAVAAAAAGYTGTFNMGGPSGVATAGGNASLFSVASNGASIFSAGKTLFSGFQNALLGSGSGGSSIFGSSIGGSDILGGNGFGSSFAPSGLGLGLSIAGGAYAGYNEFNNAGGGAAGLVGGAAYGVGTTAIGLGLASAASGGGLIAGLSFLGPVGWAGIALMAVDMLSGGKLFGTAGKFNFGQTALTVGPGGATATAGYDVKGQAPLFGGSTHDWHTVQPSQAAIDAANQFYAALLGGVDNFAKQFGVKAGDIVGGQFIQNFDKNGNPTTSSSTVLGVTYNDTAQQFQERLIAENELAVLGQFDKNLDAAVNQFRSNADTLAAITGSLATAELAMQGGTKFLALGTDQSLSALLKLAEGAEQFGESIDQTLQRIVQAQQQYDQFVGQFKDTSYVDDFEKSISQISTTMAANIKQANALAIAAGAAGASQTDLANIEKYAAQQAAQALVALEASAQSLAFGLGLTVQGSLSDVNSEIQALQSKAGTGSTAVNDFGNAMQTAAQKATDAMNLLLGDLSPLNDQEKLQKALEGLRSGSVTADQVLQIGRRLYASTQAYSDLFNTVMAIGQHAANTGTGGFTGGSAQHGLTASEQQRLSDLLKEQQSLQAAATLQQYQQLAQQVAEIASAKGEDWQQILKDMGVNIDAFEKGLNLSDSQTGDYIGAIQKQTDANGDNTKSLIDAINRLIEALGGTVPTDGTGAGDGTGSGSHSGHGTSTPVSPPGIAPPTTPPAHGGHGTDSVLDPQTAQMLGRAFARGAGVLGSRSSRSNNGRSSARV